MLQCSHLSACPAAASSSDVGGRSELGMPNAFQNLSDDTYGPQFRHNALVIGEFATTTQQVASLLASGRGERSMGIAAAVIGVEPAGPPPEVEGPSADFEALQLDDLDPEDFDIVIVITGHDGCDRGEVLDTAWTGRAFFKRWDPQPSKGQEQVRQLMEKIDDAAVRSACGAGTSC